MYISKNGNNYIINMIMIILNINHYKIQDNKLYYCKYKIKKYMIKHINHNHNIINYQDGVN